MEGRTNWFKLYNKDTQARCEASLSNLDPRLVIVQHTTVQLGFWKVWDELVASQDQFPIRIKITCLTDVGNVPTFWVASESFEPV